MFTKAPQAGRRLATILLAGASLAHLPAIALAQDSDNDIVVTGRQRAEQIQDVPLSITAFNESFIESAVPTTISDFARYTPNADLADNNFAGNALNASIRGISFADLEKSFEPAIGVAIDGVYLGTSTTAAFDVFDVDSIEILRGPQGTLAGRNTIGGTINIRRSRPTGEAGLRLGARLGRYEQRDYQLVANTPSFGDGQFAAKVFAFYREGELFARNAQRPSDQDKGLDNFQGGVSLAYDHAGGGFDALATIDFYTDRSRFVPPANITRPGADTGGPGAAPTFCDLGLILFGDPSGCGFPTVQAANDSGLTSYNALVPFRNYIDGWNATLEANWAISDSLKLTSITGYRDSDELLSEDNIGSPGFLGGLLPIFVAVRVQEYSQFSQELRFSWDASDDLGIVYGLYYLNTEYAISPGRMPNEVPGASALPPAQTYAFGGPAQIFFAGQTLDSWAGYAEGVYAFAPQWSVTLGARYTYETKDFYSRSVFGGNIPGTTTPDPNGIFNFTGSESWGAATGRIIVDWQPTDDLLIYGGWSRGFRSGGWNGRGTRVTALGPYDPEYVDSFEAGIRADVLGGRLRINPTIFHSTYKDQQAEFLRPNAAGTATETVVQNAASATISGAELEVQWAVTEAFTLRGAFGYLDASFDEFLVPDLTTGQIVDVADQRLIRRAPRYTTSVVANYVAPVGPHGSITLNGAYSWKDDFSSGLFRDPFDRNIIEAYGQADFNISYDHESPSGRSYRITGFIKDAFAEEDARIAATLDVGVFAFAIPVQTKTYGIEFSASF